MKDLLKLYLILCVCLSAACVKEENRICLEPQNLGLVELDSSSRRFLNYDQFSVLTMTTSGSQDMHLEIAELAEELVVGQIENDKLPCVIDKEETVQSIYQRERLGYDLLGDKTFRHTLGFIGMRVMLQKSLDPKLLTFKDILEVFPLITSSNEQGFEVGDDPLLTMSWYGDQVENATAIKFHDVLKFRTRWYDEVYEGPLSEEGIKVFVRKDLGIVGISSIGTEVVYLKRLR